MLTPPTLNVLHPIRRERALSPWKSLSSVCPQSGKREGGKIWRVAVISWENVFSLATKHSFLSSNFISYFPFSFFLPSLFLPSLHLPLSLPLSLPPSLPPFLLPSIPLQLIQLSTPYSRLLVFPRLVTLPYITPCP